MSKSSILPHNYNIHKEFAPFELHLIFGDERSIAKNLQNNPDYYTRHPRRRYGKTRYDAITNVAERNAAKARDRKSRKAA